MGIEKVGFKMGLLESAKIDDRSNIKALIDLGIYKSEDEFMHDALKNLLQDKELRLKLAMHRYQTDNISLSKAAEIAGVCWEDMKRILIKNGIRPRLGPATIEEAQQDYLNAERIYEELHL